MPFGLFMAVNNHFQSIILGGVLMRDERVESSKWVFAEFMRMIGGKDRHPQTILTGSSSRKTPQVPYCPHGMASWCGLFFS